MHNRLFVLIEAQIVQGSQCGVQQLLLLRRLNNESNINFWPGLGFNNSPSSGPTLRWFCLDDVC